METTFTPMVIGLPDIKKEKAIIDFYYKLCRDASALLYNLEDYLECQDRLEMSDFFNFLNANDPKEFLYLSWVKIKGVELPLGLSIDKVIELDLIDVPRNEFSNLITWRKELLEMVKRSTEELKFFFPLQKLFDERPDYRGFYFTALDVNDFETKEFDQALYDHVRIFTTSQQENNILEKIIQFVEMMNEFVSIGLIANDKQRWEHYLNTNLINNLVFTPGADKPFSINKIVTNRLILKKDLLSSERVFDKKTFSKVFGSVGDILSFTPEDQPVGEVLEA